MNHPPSHGPCHSAVVGLQWGDEGKGKIVDLLTAEHDVIVRYNGGANAGHTVVIGDRRYALHLVPSGILSPGKLSVIGNGVVVDPVTLLEEIDTLREQGIEVGDNLRVSARAHVVMPYHKMYDEAMETALAGSATGETATGALGTTKRGIGPAYADKVYRATALRVDDLLDGQRLWEKLQVIGPIQSARLAALGAPDARLDPRALTVEYESLGQRIAPFVTDTTYLLHEQLDAGRSMLFEGANACLLDVDHGTYPYVTSSNCSTLGVPAGTGVPFFNIHRVIGIMKAYATRVGAGPFPTEQDNQTGDRIRDRGQEYGTTTGRPRRCGWLDLVAVRYSAMLCGATSLACMLLDVMSGFDEVRLCTRYRLPDGTETGRFIPDAQALAEIEPVYETLPGWAEETAGVTDRAALPAEARAYLQRIEQLVGVPVELVSVGPERSQTLKGA